jgi:predicted secreted hydrolase
MLGLVHRRLVVGVLLLSGGMRARGEVEPYREAAAGYHYSFPRDHFEHPEFRTEWWYYTGNVHDAKGRRFGFELVFFRQGQRRGLAANRSAWRVDDLYLAHLALTDIDGKRFYNHQRLNRAGPGMAGASFREQRVWNGNWSATWQRDRQVLEATADEFHFRLDVKPAKPPVVHGIDGVSQKGDAAGEASYYVSLTRLLVSGELAIGSERHTVTGMAWMDHEWFTNQLGKEQIGWDWFSVQLNDQTELMLFRLRRRDGSIDTHSSGTYVDGQGRARHLTSTDFSLTPMIYWRSARTGTSYPVAWRIRVPSLGIELDVRASFDAQEMVSEEKAGPTYWEGAVTYSGSVEGVGYLEMTGYDRPFQMN